VKIHILAWDDTDQAECCAEEDGDEYTYDPTKVTCEHCLQAIDDREYDS
jgi:hypothetical protein